ncbi:hypothetical protein AAFP30_18445 [Gordonia sp. CPCC 205515]|uniref:hypothetical protein n=1 Tax=Gordonia sp. CPCC 205515 TaxID=3140791 RepID=UPI003AF3851C
MAVGIVSILTILLGVMNGKVTAAALAPVGGFWLLFLVWRNAGHEVARLLTRATGLPLDRLRLLGRHIAVTPDGIVLDLPRSTEFLPWNGIRGVPPSILHPDLSPGDPRAAETLIVGNGYRTTRRLPYRTVGAWSDPADATPVPIAVDVAAFLEAPQYRWLVRTLRRYCVGMPETTTAAHPIGSPETEVTANDDWLAEAQLGRTGRWLRAWMIAVLAVVGGFWAVGSIGTEPPERAAVTVTIIAAVLVLVGWLPSLFEWIGLPTRSLRWLGCHLAVTTEGLIVTRAGRTEFLPWTGMQGVQLVQMDSYQARLLRVPPIARPTIVGTGTSRVRHVALSVGMVGRTPGVVGAQVPVGVDLGAFVDLEQHSEISRSVWRYRPDVAAALGLPAPLSLTQSHAGKRWTQESERGSILGENDNGRTVAVEVGSYGRILVDHTFAAGRIVVHGSGIPTVLIDRDPAAPPARTPIGTADPRGLHAWCNGTPVRVEEINRSPLSGDDHQISITDGYGNLLRIKAQYFVARVSVMQAYRGVGENPLPLMVRRHNDGRVDVRTTTAATNAPTPAEVALAVAIAAALGTKSYQARNSVRTMFYRYNRWSRHL